MNQTLILASQSPRRKELLAQLGYQFDCISSDIDETELMGESASHYVNRLALAKAQHIAKNQPDTTIVLGSDTTVVYQNTILGKPETLAESINMLTMLSNNTHHVLTSVAAVKGSKSNVIEVITDVTFKALTEQEMINYWHTNEPQDKAGSYGIQGIGGQFVTHINGSYSAVVGLPLYETTQLLAEFGLPSPIAYLNDSAVQRKKVEKQ
ncbi:Maf family protein [Thalassotalea profundi]|uniref:dTTP/UTP pyrophosphatase n=1 Tax=Thalassotalea profundi TaxID=2036687 RepID=A0ABQ3J134_9GAMM|nr:Maf family protein [Thalassotalea profundi]GHE99237.1 Maf-like protein [Thalassotalea profundi]